MVPAGNSTPSDDEALAIHSVVASVTVTYSVIEYRCLMYIMCMNLFVEDHSDMDGCDTFMVLLTVSDAGAILCETPLCWDVVKKYWFIFRSVLNQTN